jgi:hypothetical protein
MVAMMLAMALTRDAAREDAVRKLSTQRITVDFDQVKLADALDFLRDATGLNLVLLPSGAAKDAEQPVRLKAKDLTVKSVLKLLLQPRGLSVSWRDGALAIVPQEEIQDVVALKIYDVRSQQIKLPDFPGPRMELAAPASANPVGITLFDLSDPKPLLEDDMLIDLIRSNTGGRSWENGKATIDLVNGRLVINQSPAVHREVEDLLRRLGQYR